MGPDGFISSVAIVEVLVILLLVYTLVSAKRRTELLAKQQQLQSLLHLQPASAGQKSYAWVIFVTIGMSAGYASLVLLQHHLMGVMEGNRYPAPPHKHNVSFTAASLGDVSKAVFEAEFKHAASFEYIFNLIFRLAHNLVFACFIPRHRVYVAMSAMMSSMLLIGVGIYHNQATSLGWVYVAYSLGGVGWGTFESNLLSCITPLGHDTKVWAITGIPVGFMTISVIGFWIRSTPPFGLCTKEQAHGFPEYLYYYVATMLLVGAVIFRLFVPHQKAVKKEYGFAEGMGKIGEWLPLIWPHCIALLVQNYALSFFTAFPFYVYNADSISMVHATGTGNLMNTNRFWAIFNLHTFMGDTISRKMSYYFGDTVAASGLAGKNAMFAPLMYLLLTCVGAVLSLARMPILLWPGLFLIFLANGAVYASSTKYIDENVGRQFNLLALSVWLFVGDIGSVLGSNTWEYAQPVLCDGALGAHGWTNFCIKESW